MENIQDWCISRQIWWGHRLPVYYCKNCQKQANDQSGIIVSRIKPEKCPACGSSDIYQDEDVLDTWFSSWLWPFATFYWPELKGLSPQGTVPKEDLQYFYPTSVLVTAPEIIFFWVARMIMAGMEFMGDIPFKDVYIHGTVRDIAGKKMSKSLGNIIDPLEIIDEYGADALRFSLISITAQGQDVFLSKERFEQGRNFANKIWNASRFILLNLDTQIAKGQSPAGTVPCKELDLVNRWILSRFYSVLKELERNLEHYKFNEAANLLYGFFWHEFCDWYLELAKPILVNRVQSTEYRNTQIVMYKVLEKSLRILHPFMPFITEEIWQRLNGLTGKQANRQTSIMLQPWPQIEEAIIDKKLEKAAESIFNLITQIRNLRSSIELKPEQRVRVSLYPHTKINRALLKDNSGLMINLARLEGLELLDVNKRPPATISAVVEDIDIYLHFSGLLDITGEQRKIKTKIEQLERAIKANEAQLKNRDFLKRAPREIVEQEKEGQAKLADELKRLEKMFHELH
jgi:valyl-tRNA synthetase